MLTAGLFQPMCCITDWLLMTMYGVSFAQFPHTKRKEIGWRLENLILQWETIYTRPKNVSEACLIFSKLIS